MPDIRNKRRQFANAALYVQPQARPPAPPKKRGRNTNHERNAAFLAEWDACMLGEREAVAHRYGIKNRQSGAVIAHRIRRHGKASSWPEIAGHGKCGVRQ